MRRQAANKVKSLPLASKEELEEKVDDLCPICYQVKIKESCMVLYLLYYGMKEDFQLFNITTNCPQMGA